MLSLVETRQLLIGKTEHLAAIRAEAGPDLDLEKITSIQGDTHYKAAELNRLMTEVNELGVDLERLQNIENIGKMNAMIYDNLTKPVGGLPQPGGGANGAARGYGYRLPTKSMAEVLGEHPGFKAFRERRVGSVMIEFNEMTIKTLVTLADISPQADRRDLQEMGVEERTVADLMLNGTTTSNTVDYYEETTLTNNAAETAEGSAYPESVEGWTLRTENVRDIGHFIPATTDSLDDVALLESFLRGRLAYGVRRREETQILNGAGTGILLRGILNRTGLQTQAKGADPIPDAIYKGLQLVRGSAGLGFAEPTAIVMHPADITDYKLLRSADGIYLSGMPSDEGPDRMWGKPIRQTTAIPQNTSLVGAFRPHSEVIRRTGIQVLLSSEHATNFTERKVTIRADERIALAVYRPSAFCQITGV